MLMPKRVKFRKMQRGRRRGRARKGTEVTYGEYGLQALEPCWMSSRQIEAARRAITHHIRRGGKVWIRVFPDKSVTGKPAETRMGGGKGNPEYWVAVVQPERMLIELAGVPEGLAREAMLRAAHKLPIATRFVVGARAGEAEFAELGQRMAAQAAAEDAAAAAAEEAAAAAAALELETEVEE